MRFFNGAGLNVQLILVVISTAVIISVVDNIVDAYQAAESSQQREQIFNQTIQHHNETTRTLEFLTNSTAQRDAELAPIFEQFQNHIDITRENNELSRELITELNNTNNNSNSSS